jgi:formamidopyrimidine-DNA glycosylase
MKQEPCWIVNVPELPEVETVKRGLAPIMEGARLQRLELRREGLRFPFPDSMADLLEGRAVEALSRRAKFLLIHFSGGMSVIAHLGMSGSFRIEEDAALAVPGDFHHARSKDEKHDHVVFHLDHPEKGLVRIIYNDPRRFGFMVLSETAQLSDHAFLRALGPEPTGNSLGGDVLALAFADKKAPLKSALLDQKVIAGLGNIYVCEALHRSGLSPTRAAGSLVTAKGKAKPQLELLASAIREVIAAAIAAGGSSLKDHIQTDGSLGYFQHRFHVYDREGAPCPTPGCGKTIMRIVQAGRSTFFCAACQK